MIAYSQGARKGYVYLLHPVGHNVYKIGCTVDLVNRLQRMQRGRDVPLEYVACIPSDDYELLEQRLHRIYRRFRLDGEWFALTPEDVEYIRGLAS